MVQGDPNGDEILPCRTSDTQLPYNPNPSGQDCINTSCSEYKTLREADKAHNPTLPSLTIFNRSTPSNPPHQNLNISLAPSEKTANQKSKPHRSKTIANRGRKRNRKGVKKSTTSAGRGATFTEKELHSLLDILEEKLPVGGHEWDVVTATQ
ncbi:hypothetical protein BWQ96_01746 [Gracilariopsis chorda]|uniref:Uncharacterized protein n=1 Tax=Gracilariopsis chorda TaxID=448386 RepID=A0A2V3J3K7_9FLOR|nr:hypothetical protein BWQ96_01746 [Gracilariopsis chorda]|eukprot:PXF48577.1 hypothetical protein BWQ96_01746 [Gracilariopsis chorda]